MASVAEYPVLWAEQDEEPVSGRLTTGRGALQFRGGRNGRVVARTLDYRELAGVRIGRRGDERVGGRTALVVERRDAPALLVRPLGAGLLMELADLLSELCAVNQRLERVAVVLPLKASAVEQAAELVAEGPPFDLADASLDRHDVFVTGSEAIFVFSGADACETVRRLVGESDVWTAAECWSACLDGPPRLAEAAFAWKPE